MELADEHGVIGVLAMRLQELNFAGVPDGKPGEVAEAACGRNICFR